MVDEAYVTYSHARNFAHSGRLVHHLSNPHFSVSSPLYTVLLGIGGRLGFNIPELGKTLSAASIFGSSAYLMLLCFRHNLKWVGFVAGMVLVTSPALWLTLGLESSFFLLLVLAAYYHFYRGQYVAAALLAALAALTRAEGLLFAGVLVFFHFLLNALRRNISLTGLATALVEAAVALLFTWKALVHVTRGENWESAIAGLVAVVSVLVFAAVLARTNERASENVSEDPPLPFVQPHVCWTALGVFLAVLIPAFLYLTHSYDLSLRTALLTQQGWAAVGLAGFEPGTSFLKGLQIMVNGWVDQSLWYFLWLILVIFGIAILFRSPIAWAVYAWESSLWQAQHGSI